jgi:hypothetical protein
MTDDDPAALRRAFARRDDFHASGDAFTHETTVCTARVELAAADGDRDGAVTLTVRVPTLHAAVDGEVADVVADGWLETFDRRIEDAFDVARTVDHDVPAVAREGDDVVVTLGYRARSARTAVEDAKALVDFVEGTYAQGVIPGYDYGEPVASLVQRATENAQGEGGDRGGTPL